MTVAKVGFVSLGCPKALVDSERILTQLKCEGYQVAPSYHDADLVIVNTCGFIDQAKAESLEAIGEALNENGKVIVTGCLGAQPDEIHRLYPHLLAVTGPQQYEQVMQAVHAELAPPIQHDPLIDLMPPQGVKLTPRHYAYLKISEGCNHRCSFCIIPSMRGDLVSRLIGNILQEAENLAKSGVKELLVISQDTSAYGVDLRYKMDFWNGRPIKSRFLELCQALGELGIWVRLHYVYPYPHVDAVIPLMAEGKILPYLDIPFQHASPSVLRAMKRPAFEDKTLERIHQWRDICPELTIRSTFIVGFPGETEADFEHLLDWLTEAQIDRLGCFQYSPVNGAVANTLPNPVSETLKQERWDRLMAHQQHISQSRLKKKVGETVEVLIDKSDEDGIEARTKGDAPDIDGVVHLPPNARVKSGDMLKVKVIDSDDYDLWAEPLQ